MKQHGILELRRNRKYHPTEQTSCLNLKNKSNSWVEFVITVYMVSQVPSGSLIVSLCFPYQVDKPVISVQVSYAKEIKAGMMG